MRESVLDVALGLWRLCIYLSIYLSISQPVYLPRISSSRFIIILMIMKCYEHLLPPTMNE